MNIERALTIEGFTNPRELEWLARQASISRCIVEVGSWQGRSTRAIADNAEHDTKIIAVDTWAGTAGEHEKELNGKPEGWLFDTFHANMEGSRVQPTAWHMDSLRGAKFAAKLGFKFDMIFIDAAHDYANVVADIKAWRPLLAPGGLFCGHDFDGGRPGVVRAVREFVPTVRLANAGSIWYQA